MGTLRLFPLNTVLFPGAVLDVQVFEPRYRRLVEECREDGQAFGVCLIREGDEAGEPDVMPCEIGTTAEIAEVRPLEGGRYFLRSIGRRRFRIERIVDRRSYLLAEVSYLDDGATSNEEDSKRLAGELRDAFGQYMRLLVEFSGGQPDLVLPDDPSEVSYRIADSLQVADAMKQRLLELASTEQRLRVELQLLRRLLPQLRALVERRREVPPSERSGAPGGASRAEQERFFGRHFSLN
jgi:Lon protease-like protein